MSLVRALDWLLGEKVSLINMSLAGPDNRILASAVAKTLASGTAIVAAVGNEGPAAPPLFPAAYPGVIAVTAVDSKSKIYRWANRGDQVYFAAPGVNIISARSDGDYGRESGTSMAAPVVAAFLACEMHQHKRDEALALLSNKAKDLGEPGRDQVFGVGLLAPVPSP
jgi:subtilisin family serine protease